MKHNLTLVQLSDKQIVLAKEANGSRTQITHGVICGPHGQRFGTEKQCRKYYSAWEKIFPYLFDKGVETKSFEIINYKETFNLVNILIKQHDLLEKANEPSFNPLHNQKKEQPTKGIFSRLWARVTGA